MGRLVWFGVVALSPVSAVAAVISVAALGAAVGYAVAKKKKRKE